MTDNVKRMFAEEVLASIHLMVALVLFNYGWDVAGWVFVVRALFDEWGAVTAAKAVLKEREAE